MKHYFDCRCETCLPKMGQILQLSTMQKLHIEMAYVVKRPATQIVVLDSVTDITRTVGKAARDLCLSEDHDRLQFVLIGKAAALRMVRNRVVRKAASYILAPNPEEATVKKGLLGSALGAWVIVVQDNWLDPDLMILSSRPYLDREKEWNYVPAHVIKMLVPK